MIKLKKDIFLSTKTGSGKSLCYHMIPEILDKRGVVLVFSPLIAIMEEQIFQLRSLGFTAGMVKAENMEDIKKAEFQFLFGSPEAMLDSIEMRKVLASDLYRERCSYIVVDEAHTVISWGESSSQSQTEAFRETFSRIGEVRSLMPRSAMIALTATASFARRRKILRSLGMSKCEEIVDSPDRPNVKLSIEKLDASQELEEIFTWMTGGLELNGRQYERQLIFVKSIKDCAKLYQMFIQSVPARKENVNMYHSMTPDHIKEHIRNDMNIVDGKIRILIATNAAGMGVNFAGVNNVINYGPPSDMDTYLQQVGRAGRDGSQGHALLLYLPTQMRNLDSDMLGYLRHCECRRKYILDCYNSKCDVMTAHKCCDTCTIDCQCRENPDGSCPLMVHESMEHILEDSMSDASMDTIVYREVSEVQRKELKKELTTYKSTVENSNDDIIPVLDQLTNVAIIEIITKCAEIFSVDDLLRLTSVPSLHVATCIIHIMQSIFGEMITDMSGLDYIEDDDI